jgi:hypothetical protein
MFAWQAYHQGNEEPNQPGRYRSLTDLMQRHWPEARTLVDFGCGHGHFLRDAREAGWKAHGIEMDPMAQERAAAFSGCPVSDLAGAPATDVVCALNSLVAVPDPTEILRRLKAPRLVLDMAVEENPRLALVARLAARPNRQAPEGTPTLLWRASVEGLTRWLASLGYRPVHLEVTDAGWPYIMSSNPVRRAVGRLSILTSRFVPSFGDRLLGLYERTEH